MTTLKRKLYRRGSSFETTIPMPLLFALDKEKKHNVLFRLDAESNRWYIEFEAGESGDAPKKEVKSKRGVSKRGRSS